MGPMCQMKNTLLLESEHLQRENKWSTKGSDAWDVKNGTDPMCTLWERKRGGDTCMISVEPWLSL